MPVPLTSFCDAISIMGAVVRIGWGLYMSWWQYAILGAGGGALVEALSLFTSITVWQNARRRTTGELKEVLPSWRSYVDVPVHIWQLLTRMFLGAVAAALFGVTGQISGAFAAVAFGAAAPAVLAQLGSIPPVAGAIRAATHVPPVEPAEGGGA
jgi:hypothetical protein